MWLDPPTSTLIIYMANSVATTPTPPSSDDRLLPTKAGFNPTVADVVEVRHILTELGVANHVVPMELALMILSFASYCPRCTGIKQKEVAYHANDFWREGPHADVAGLYLTVTTLSVPNTVAKARSITFQMNAADQGWADAGGHGTYNNSHTWYEASILRPQSDAFTAAALLVDEMGTFPTPGNAWEHFRSHGWDFVEGNSNETVVWKVHNNITASSEYRHYRVDWVAGVPTNVEDPAAMGDGQGFLELLAPDDVVALWARAEQQAWVNRIQEATIQIEYEVL
ncbi:hypothetical protein F4777DRAFT_569451 [Nemania sp. FL0916]|nr:hypothetical protein F4777DRAFT_569451 [Nemania sp. FL0916]